MVSVTQVQTCALCLKRANNCFHPQRGPCQPYRAGSLQSWGHACATVPVFPKKRRGRTIFFLSVFILMIVAVSFRSFLVLRAGCSLLFNCLFICNLGDCFLTYNYVWFSFNKTFHFCNFISAFLFFSSFVSQRSLDTYHLSASHSLWCFVGSPMLCFGLIFQMHCRMRFWKFYFDQFISIFLTLLPGWQYFYDKSQRRSYSFVKWILPVAPSSPRSWINC